MVLQVGAHLRAVEDDGDAEAVQVIGGADAGKLQKARGADGAGGEDDFGRGAVGGLGRLDADRPALLDDDPQDLLAGLHGQVRAAEGGLQEGGGGGGAAVPALGELVVAQAVLGFSGEVAVAGDAELGPGGEEGLADREGRAGLADAEGAVFPVVAVVVGVVRFRLAEVGQDILIAPAGAAHLAPVVIVLRIAAGVELRVDRGAAADHLGLGVADGHPLHVPLRHGVPAPAPDALRHLREACGQVVERVPVAAPGLEEEDLCGGVLAEPRGKDAARGSATDDDVVMVFGHLGASVRPGAKNFRKFLAKFFEEFCVARGDGDIA